MYTMQSCLSTEAVLVLLLHLTECVHAKHSRHEWQPEPHASAQTETEREREKTKQREREGERGSPPPSQWVLSTQSV